MSNPNADVKSVLLQEINTKHQLNLQPSDVTFDPPSLLDATVLDFTDPIKRNSRVLVHAGTAGGPTLDVTVDFNRLGLAKSFTNRSTEFPDTQQSSAHALLSVLSERLGTDVTAEDIEDTVINRSGIPGVTLQAKTTSMKFIGSVAVTLKQNTQPVAANRMLFANSSVAKLTDDLVEYQDIAGSYAPVVTGEKTALMAGLAEGFLMALQGDYFNENVTMNYRPGANAQWAAITWPGRLWSTYMVVFQNIAYFAMSEPSIDPWGKTCGLYRIIFNDDGEGGYTPTYERVLDMYVAGSNVEMTVDPITDRMIVAMGSLHVTSDGVDWQLYELPRLKTGPTFAEKPKIVGLSLYNNELRVVSGWARGGSDWTEEQLEYLMGPFNMLDPSGYQIYDRTFGPHGNYTRVEYGDPVSFYYGPEGMFMGMGGVTPYDENGYIEAEQDIGQIWKFDEILKKWNKVASGTGIINGLFIKLENALVWAGGNRDNLGGQENLVVSYDSGNTWQPDPSNPNSPFKLDPTRPSSITAVNLDAWTGLGMTGLPSPNLNVIQTWPDNMPYSGFSQAVDIGGDYLISAGNKLLYVTSNGEVNESWSSDYAAAAPKVWAMNDGGYFLFGDASKWKGQPTGYVNYCRIKSDGTVDTTFVEPTSQSTYNSLPNLTRLRNGGWLAWGTLIRWNNEEVAFITKLDEDFNRVPGWGVNIDTYNSYLGVTGLVELPDGTILFSAGHHPDRTTRTAWYFINPATGAEIQDYGLNLGSGQRDPQFDQYPVLVDGFQDPNDDSFWLFTSRRSLPNSAWGIRYDTTTKEVITELINGETLGTGKLSWVTFNGEPHLLNSTSYRGRDELITTTYKPTFMEFYTRDGEVVSAYDKPFNIVPHNNSGGIADVRTIKLSGEDYLLYGNFGYVEQNPYPRYDRVASRNLCKMSVASGLS